MITGKELVERLGMHPTSIQKAGFGLTEELDSEKLIQFLSGRRKPAGAWRPEKAALADQWYCELTGEEPLTVGASYAPVPSTERSDDKNPVRIILPDIENLPARQRPTAPPAKQPIQDMPAQPAPNLEAPKNFLRSDGFTIVMLIIAIVAQTLHTATFFYFLTPVPDSILRYITAAVVGIGVDAAALVATIQSQKKWYLWAFAAIHFGINMSAHFRFADSFGDLDTDTYHFWFDSALLSGAVAFAVYCYSNVFAFKK